MKYEFLNRTECKSCGIEIPLELQGWETYCIECLDDELLYGQDQLEV